MDRTGNHLLSEISQPEKDKLLNVPCYTQNVDLKNE
jgi:hypothetical protein